MFPRKIMFKNNILNKYVINPITKIKIIRYSDNTEVITEDKNKTLELVNSLANLEVSKSKNNIPTTNKEIYYISIYENSNMNLGLTVYDTGYVSIFGKKDDTIHQYTYKIIKNSDIFKIIKTNFTN